MAELTLPSKFKTLWQHCSALSNANYWVSVDGLGNAELEDDMRSAAHVVHGGMLHKFRKSGREKPHRRFVRATGGTTAPDGRRSPVVLQWDKKAAPVVRADEQVYESCFQGGPAPDAPGCFQVILDKRMVFLVADSAEEKQIWVLGDPKWNPNPNPNSHLNPNPNPNPRCAALTRSSPKGSACCSVTTSGLAPKWPPTGRASGAQSSMPRLAPSTFATTRVRTSTGSFPTRVRSRSAMLTYDDL